MLPWRLFALGHWDVQTARHTAAFAMQEWRLAQRAERDGNNAALAEGVQHRLTIQLMSNHDFVRELEAFSAGAALRDLPTLSSFVLPLVFAPVAERKGTRGKGT